MIGNLIFYYKDAQKEFRLLIMQIILLIPIFKYAIFQTLRELIIVYTILNNMKRIN